MSSVDYEKEVIKQVAKVLDLHGAMSRQELEELLSSMIMQAYHAGAVYGFDKAKEILDQALEKTIEQATKEPVKWRMN